jgi:hypothetical protein
MNVTISNLAGDFDPTKTLVTAADVVGIGQGAFILIGEPNTDVSVVDPSSTVDIAISITDLNPLYTFQGLSLTSGNGVLAAGGLSDVTASVGSTFIETAGGKDLVTSPGGPDGTPVALPGTINFNDDTANWDAANGWTLAQHRNQWAINTPAAGEGTFISFTYTTEAVPQLFEERFMATLSFTPVPEPSVAVLSGLFGLGLIARRRR